MRFPLWSDWAVLFVDIVETQPVQRYLSRSLGLVAIVSALSLVLLRPTSRRIN